MKITFVSVAALSLTASQAAKLHKQVTPTPDQHLIQSERSPQSYSNIMESVKSLEKAFEYHKNEEKLLNDINSELKGYWNLQEQTRKQGAEEPSQLVATKQKEATKSNEKAQSETKEKEKEKSTSESQQEGKKAPLDNVNAEIDDNLKLDDMNLLQLSSELDVTNQMRRNSEAKKINSFVQQKLNQSSVQRQFALETEQALAETQMDIQQKIKAAHEAATYAENLLREAQQEQEQLQSEEQADEDAEETEEEEFDDVEEEEEQPQGYRFIEIPDYAFTTDQDDTFAEVDESADKFDLKGVITKVMELKKKAQEMAPQVLGKIKDLREKICGFDNAASGTEGLEALGI